jgi:hypothetical protein
MRGTHVFRLRAATVALPILALFMLGCDSGAAKHPVQGKVSYQDGSPMTGGMVEFQRQGDITSALAYIQPDGTYELMTSELGDGAAEGTYQVRVLPDESEEDDGDGTRKPAPGPKLHPKYKQYETSGLTFQVAGGDNTFDIKVERR